MAAQEKGFLEKESVSLTHHTNMNITITYAEVAVTNFIIAAILSVFYLMLKNTSGPFRAEGLFFLSAAGTAIVGVIAVALQLLIPAWVFPLFILVVLNLVALFPLLLLPSVAVPVIGGGAVVFLLVHITLPHLAFKW